MYTLSVPPPSQSEQCSLYVRGQLGSEDAVLVQSKDLPIPPEAKVGHATINQNTTKENTSRGPDIDPISASTVHIPIQIAFDSIRNPTICKGEEPTVREERLSVISRYIKGVTIFQSISNRNHRTCGQ